MTTQEKNGITEGVIWKQLLIFFFPILVGSFFQAPKYCEIITVAPVDTPVKKPTTRLMICPAEPPTLDSASFPTNCPTMTESTVLYNC